MCIVLLLVHSPQLCGPEPRRPLPWSSKASATNDPKEIVRRALDVDQNGFRLARNYTFERREELKVLNRRGALKKHEINTYDVTILYDEPYSRRIRKDDKPLTDKEEMKEAEKS